MSVFLRGNVWWCKFKVKGRIKPVRESCHTGNREDAEMFESRLKARYKASLQYLENGRVGLVALSVLDIDRARRQQARPNEKLIKSHVMQRWKRLCQFFEPGLDDHRDPSSLSVKDLNAYIDHRKKMGVKPQTFKREIEALRRGLNLGVKKYHFPMPIAESDWPKFKPAPSNRKQKGKLRDKEIVNAWLSLLEPECRDENIFLAWTAVRKEECHRITPDMVHRVNNVRVPAILVLAAEATKTNETRTLGLLPPALAAIDRQLARRNPKALARGTIFSGRDFKNQMSSASKKLGLTDNLTRRDLRHTFLSRSLQHGADKKAILSAGGHKTIAAADLYQSTTPERNAEAAMAFAASQQDNGAHSQGTMPTEAELEFYRKMLELHSKS